jgi:aminopeptidase YwaD
MISFTFPKSWNFIFAGFKKNTMKNIVALLSVLLITANSFAQDCKVIPPSAMENIKENLSFLANDELEGRLPGTRGANVASDFIAEKFQEFGLVPYTENGTFYQNFEMSDWVNVNTNKTTLSIDGESKTLNESFYVLPQSSNESVSGDLVYVGFGIEAEEQKHNDYKKLSEKKLKGKIFVIDVSSPDGIHPHSKYLAYHNLDARAEKAVEKGAIGIIFVNEGEMASDPKIKFRKIKNSGVPVVFLKEVPGEKAKKLKYASIEVLVKEQMIEARNVVGLWNNNAERTLIIGAHYDHLGWGEDNSLYKGERAIHNGADDNASGTTGLIELANFFSKDTNFTSLNVLFIAFSGEERGLLGSKYFSNNMMLPPEAISYMLNMDMIGRLEDRQLAVSGTGTASKWEEVLEYASCDLDLKLSESGVGPSDHTSFYRKNIPVLHFFTGTHKDYHKPSDDAELINFEGIYKVLNVMVNVIYKVGDRPLEFLVTKDNSARSTPKFNVTLGIVPDYMYEEGGVKIDGVTEGKPASTGGLQEGDIIVQMGKVKVTDMYSYMDALALYKKGDEITVVAKREGTDKEFKVKF